MGDGGGEEEEVTVTAAAAATAAAATALPSEARDGDGGDGGNSRQETGERSCDYRSAHSDTMGERQRHVARPFRVAAPLQSAVDRWLIAG